MKICAYCTTTFKSRKEVNFWRMPYSSMGASEPVCDKCALRLNPELATELTGFIGVKI